MGILLETIGSNKKEPPKSAIAKRLSESNFKYERYVCGSDLGYQRCFQTEDDLYYVLIHCNLKDGIVKIYKEYDCGGKVSSGEAHIPDYIIWNDDTEAFMKWLDEEAESYLQT